MASIVVLFLVVLYFAVPQSMHYWLHYWWMFPVALIIALTVNTVGISGAALFVPFFILLFPLLSGTHISAIDSVKLGLVTESFGLSSSALAFLAFGLVDITLARQAMLRAAPLLIVGVLVAFFVPKSILYMIIVGFLFLRYF